MAEEPKHEMPSVTASTIAMKGITLDREVKYLVNKARIGKKKADDEAAAKAAKEKAEARKKAKKAEKEANATKEGETGKTHFWFDPACLLSKSICRLRATANNTFRWRRASRRRACTRPGVVHSLLPLSPCGRHASAASLPPPAPVPLAGCARQAR